MSVARAAQDDLFEEAGFAQSVEEYMAMGGMVFLLVLQAFSVMVMTW